jgi:hypothetical protein
MKKPSKNQRQAKVANKEVKLPKPNFYAFNSNRTWWMQAYAESEAQAKQIVANNFELKGDQLKDINVVFDN